MVISLHARSHVINAKASTGYKMSALKENLYSEAQVDFVEEDAVSPSDIFGGGKVSVLHVPNIPYSIRCLCIPACIRSVANGCKELPAVFC